MTTSSLRGHRDFQVLWISSTISELGSRISAFAFPLVGYALTGSALLASLTGALHLLGLVATLLPAGVLADRVDRRLLMRTSAAIGLLTYLSLVLAGALGALTVPHLAVAALVTGVAAGLFEPVEMSAIRQVVPREALPAALSRSQARQHVATLVGGPLGGLLYGVARWLPFVADAASYLLAWVMLGRLRTDLSPSARAGSHPLADLREGLAHLWRTPLLRTLACFGFGANLAINTLFTVALLRLVVEGVDPVQLGLVETVAGAAGILGAMVAPRLIERLPTGWLTIAVAWSPLPLVVPMAVWGHPVVVAAALAGVLVLNPAGNAGMASYRLTVTPEAIVGRVQAASQFVAMASLPLAPLVAGALLVSLGGPSATLAAGAVCGLVALVPTTAACVRAVPRPSGWVVAPA